MNKIYVIYTKDNKRHPLGYKCTEVKYSPCERFVECYCDVKDSTEKELMVMYPMSQIAMIKCIDKREDVDYPSNGLSDEL